MDADTEPGGREPGGAQRRVARTRPSLCPHPRNRNGDGSWTHGRRWRIVQSWRDDGYALRRPTGRRHDWAQLYCRSLAPTRGVGRAGRCLVAGGTGAVLAGSVDRAVAYRAADAGGKARHGNSRHPGGFHHAGTRGGLMSDSMLTPAFDAPVDAAQNIFRLALSAMSEPGTCHDIGAAPVLAPLCAASY